MQSNKELYRRIEALPLADAQREEALTALRASEAMIDTLVGVVSALRAAARWLERQVRGLGRGGYGQGGVS